MQYAIMTAIFAVLSLPLAAVYFRVVTGKRAKFALIGNIVSFFMLCLLSTVYGIAAHAAGEPAGAAAAASDGLKYIGAGLAVGLACIGGGIAVSSSASSAIGAISENEKLLGKSLIFVALAEGVAIYGLVIAFMILNA